MAVIGLSTLSGRMTSAGAPHLLPEMLVERSLRDVPPGAPVVVMLHGFRYHPGNPASDPHRTIYAPKSGPGVASWPEGLGFGGPDGGAGLCIGFGWEGTADPNQQALIGLARFATVYRKAADTAPLLATLINAIGEIDPARKVDVMAHSLGARVALRALPDLRQGNLGRVILLGAAEYESEVVRMIRANRSNPEAEFFNVTARANDLFDFLFERFTPRPGAADRVLGAGLSHGHRNWLDIQIDHPQTEACLARRGIALGRATRVMDHWGFYLRDGIFELYRNLIRDPVGWRLNDLRLETTHTARDRTWSALAPSLPGWRGVRP